VLAFNFVLSKEITDDGFEERPVPPHQCKKNLIVKTIWQKLYARKMTNYFPCFRHQVVFYTSVVLGKIIEMVQRSYFLS